MTGSLTTVNILIVIFADFVDHRYSNNFSVTIALPDRYEYVVE